MTYLSPRDEEVMSQLSVDHHVSSLAAAYTVYIELSPANKKPLSQREFYQRYRDNWDVFGRLEEEAISQA